MSPHKGTLRYHESVNREVEYRHLLTTAELRQLAAENYALEMRLNETECDLRIALTLINRLKTQRPG